MILLIDNYDSFVFNVKTMLESLSDEQILVARNDKITLEQILNLNPSHIILSPGPKHPKDSKICLELFNAKPEIPILGICLGHQALGLSFGARINILTHPCHAKSSKIKLNFQNELFKDFPNEFCVMRYHSLEVVNLPSELEPLAFSDDGILMAMKHKSLPYFGVQFHPESYFSEYGLKIFSNFLNIKNKNSSQNKQEKLEQICAQNSNEKPVSLAPYLKILSENKALESAEFAQICQILMQKKFEPIQVAALLILLSQNAMNANSLTAFVREILRYSNTFSNESDMLDIVGTGGDNFKSINISTTSAFILAALGVKVAKHGNKAISSASGSSDVLGALDIEIFSNLEENLRRLKEKRLNFFHAPFLHPLVGAVGEIRAKLGVRTIFNILGPLLHPNLKLKYQIIGTYNAQTHRLLAEVLQNLGREKAIVVRGEDGMDEFSLCAPSKVFELKNGEIIEYFVRPEDFGFKTALHSQIKGADAHSNARDLITTLKGELSGPKFDIVVLNSMFGLYVAGFANSPKEAKEMILEGIYSGRVWEFFKDYKNYAKA